MPSQSRLRIGYIPYELVHTYWAICLQGAKTRATEIHAELVIPSISADEDIRAAVDELVAKRIDAVILPGNLVVFEQYSFEAFNAAAIPAIVAELPAAPQFACAVHTNEQQGADAVVGYLAQQIGGQGDVAHLAGGAAIRHAALHRMLAREPQIELVFEAQGTWTRAEGARLMRDALSQHPDLRGVFAQNDQMALGALDVIDELGYAGQITVVGFDGTPDGLAAVHHGRLAATVYRGTYNVGRTTVDMAAHAARGEQLPREVQTDVTLILPSNLVEATLDSMALLPKILQDLLESNAAQMRLQHEIIAAQRSMIQELSTPIIPISDKILVLPLVGTIDSARAKKFVDSWLGVNSYRQGGVLIIDITGVAVVDTGVAHHLVQAARAAQLLGALVMLVGISPEVAQTVVQLGVDLSSLPTYSSLQVGLEYARRRTAR
jgi:ABC-type sugar transport system substrate-binding protein/anti-anti-sigma regulatory factor